MPRFTLRDATAYATAIARYRPTRRFIADTEYKNAEDTSIDD